MIFTQIANIFCNFIGHIDTAIFYFLFLSWVTNSLTSKTAENCQKILQNFYLSYYIHHCELKHFKFLESDSNSANSITLRYHIVPIFQVLLSFQKASSFVNNQSLQFPKICQFCCKLRKNLSNPTRLCRKLWLLFILYVISCRQSFDKKKTQKKSANFKQ